MQTAGGGWTYVARGSDITDAMVNTVSLDPSQTGIWHFDVKTIEGQTAHT